MEKPRLPIPPILKTHAETMLSMLEPCVELQEEPCEANAPPQGSRLFGRPFLHHLGDWPRTPEGRPMFFLGQLNLAELVPPDAPAARELPSMGLLSFFYDLDSLPAGVEGNDRYYFRVLWSPRIAGGGTIDPPAGAPVLPAAVQALRGRPAWRLPTEVDERFVLGVLEEEPYNAYADLTLNMAPDGEHRLLGPAHGLYSDARAQCERATVGLWGQLWNRGEASALQPAASGWCLLWQIGGNPDLDRAWGDAVHLYVMIREEDLRARRFIRCWVVTQCG